MRSLLMAGVVEAVDEDELAKSEVVTVAVEVPGVTTTATAVQARKAAKTAPSPGSRSSRQMGQYDLTAVIEITTPAAAC